DAGRPPGGDGRRTTPPRPRRRPAPAPRGRPAPARRRARAAGRARARATPRPTGAAEPRRTWTGGDDDARPPVYRARRRRALRPAADACVHFHPRSGSRPRLMARERAPATEVVTGEVAFEV